MRNARLSGIMFPHPVHPDAARIETHMRLGGAVQAEPMSQIDGTGRWIVTIPELGLRMVGPTRADYTEAFRAALLQFGNQVWGPPDWPDGAMALLLGAAGLNAHPELLWG